MDRNNGMPPAYGRGRHLEREELRRPFFDSLPTYSTEYVPIVDGGINGLRLTNMPQNQIAEWICMTSPSADPMHPPPMHDAPLDATPPPIEKEGKYLGSTLSPFAKEFVPRNFRPEPRIPAAELPDEVETPSDSYPVQELRSFLNEINMSPGKFEKKVVPLTHTLNAMVDDDDTVRAIVNIIFDESVRQPNLRYSGARLCKSLCEDLDVSPNHLNFRTVLLTRCNQEFKRRNDLAQNAEGQLYLRGFAMFLAELFTQVEVMGQRVSILGDNLPVLIKTIILYPVDDNLKCVCQILKLVGAFLEDYESSKIKNAGATPEMDSVTTALKNLLHCKDIKKNMKDMISSVIKLRENDWGRAPATENPQTETPPSPSSINEPVMYGPDGKPMTSEELMFLQSQYAGNISNDPEDYDLYDENPGEEMPDEISDAYEVFLREHGLRH